MTKTFFFRDKPLFGIDITAGSVRVVQTTVKDTQPVIVAYGTSKLPPDVVKDGTVVNIASATQSLQSIIQSSLQGTLNTHRVALSIPASRTFGRAIQLPALTGQALTDAVTLEIEQYTPIPIENMYIDYSIINKSATSVEVFAVAAPRQVVDSYLLVAQSAGFEPVLIETRVDAIKRLFDLSTFGNIPSLLLDFNQDTVDISIVDKHIIASGTVSIGQNFAKLIAHAIDKQTKPSNLSSSSTYSDEEHSSANTPDSKDNQLEQFIKEVRRMVRYYEERYAQARRIEQVVLFGNNGLFGDLSTLMTDQLRLPVRTSDVWQLFKFEKGIAPIPNNAGDEYIVAAGLSMAPPKGAFND